MVSVTAPTPSNVQEIYIDLWSTTRGQDNIYFYYYYSQTSF